MSDDVNKNKVTDKIERRAAHLEDKYDDQGMGRDEAQKRTLETAMSENLSRGGGNSAGEPKKGAHHEGRDRNGSSHGAG